MCRTHHALATRARRAYPAECDEPRPLRALRAAMGTPDDSGCAVATLPLEDGTLVTRVPYGQEREDWGATSGRPCGDCGVPVGATHHLFCDIERCGRCGDQLFSCDCPYPDELGERAL